MYLLFHDLEIHGAVFQNEAKQTIGTAVAREQLSKPYHAEQIFEKITFASSNVVQLSDIASLQGC